MPPWALPQDTGQPREPPSALLRAGGVAAASAGALFLAWGYLDVGGDPYAYGDPYRPFLDSSVAALAVSVPALFCVGLAGLSGLLARSLRPVGLPIALVAAAGLVLAFGGAAVGVVRGIEGGFGWYDAYVVGRQETTAFGLLLPWWIEWTPLLFAGLTMVGVTTSIGGRIGPFRALPLVMGVSGWAYYLTDYGGAGLRLAHIFFGVLFGLGWVALGGVLFRGGER